MTGKSHGGHLITMLLAVSCAVNIVLVFQYLSRPNCELALIESEQQRRELDRCLRNLEAVAAAGGGAVPQTPKGVKGKHKYGAEFLEDRSQVPSTAGVQHGDEIGFVGLLEKTAKITKRTRYDPVNDSKYVKTGNDRYFNSLWAPKPSLEIQVSDGRWISMGELTWAYDAWYEEYSAFSATQWMGVLMQQDPQDMLAIHDMVWRVKPDLIIEIGTNTGGSAVFLSTITRAYNPNAKIVTVDIKPVSDWAKGRSSKLCPKCALGISHPFWYDGGIVSLIGDVGTNATFRSIVQEYVDKAKIVLAIEDAGHTYKGTYDNIRYLAKWVTPGSYMLVQDTKLDKMFCKSAACGFGPMHSIDSFIELIKSCRKAGTAKSDQDRECLEMGEFVIDRSLEQLMYSQHHRGYLLKK
jgi:cephalosporin hydroxylase